MPSDGPVAGHSTVDDTARTDQAIAALAHRDDKRPGRSWDFAPGRWIPAITGIAVTAVIWQVLALHNPFVLPRLGDVWHQLSVMRGTYWQDTLDTLYETVVGLVVSFVVAFTLAVAMVHSKIIDRAAMPLAVTLNVTPIIALAPALTMAFGFGYTPRFLIAAVIVFFPFLVNGLAGLRAVDPEALDVFRTLDASPWEIFVRLRLPSSLPFLFAAGRVCLPLSIVGAVVAEFVASSTLPGLGTLISTSVQGGGTVGLAEIYGAVAILVAIGLLFTFAISLIEARVIGWRSAEHRAE